MENRESGRLGVLLLALALLIPGVAPAQSEAGRPLTVTPTRLATPIDPSAAAPAESRQTAATIRLPLRQLISAKEPIYLMTARSTYTLFVPLSPRYNVKSCKLRLKFTNSIALLSERSTLRVVLNDKVIAQYYLTRNQPDHVVDIEVPTTYLEVGSNQLQFIASQHYTLECEDPAAPELWTQVFPDESYLEAVVTWNDIYPKLSLLRDLIDQKLWNTYKFHLCFPGSSTGLSDTQLAWGSVVSQGAALNLEYRPMMITTGSQLLAGTDNVVVGTSNELTSYLTSTEIGAIDGSFIAVKQLPGDPAHFLLVLSGRNPEEVGQAVYAFSLINFPLPDSQYAQIGGINFPQKPFWIRNAPVKDPGIYSFKQMGLLKNQSIHGWNTGNVQLEVYMPGDLSPDDGGNVELRLHFAYGAAFRDDSVLNVFVNREFQYAIRLDDTRGAMHYGHKVYLPVKAFQPGRNLVEISPKMVPLITNHCMMIQEENLWFTLYRDSDFVVPKLQAKARLPNLSLFSQTAFPFTASPDGADLAVLVSGRDSTSVCAAWMLLGKMAQISGSVLNRAEISAAVPRTDKNLLVVGPLNTIPEEIFAKSPISPAAVGRMRYLMQVSPTPGATAVGPIEEILEKLRGRATERAEEEDPSTVEMPTLSELKDDTMAISFESPVHRARAATIITAADSDTLYKGVNTLQDRRFWDNLSGNLAVWGTTPRSLATAQLGPEFIYGVKNPIKQAQNTMSRDPWIFVPIVFITIGVLAFVFRYLLKRRSKES